MPSVARRRAAAPLAAAGMLVAVACGAPAGDTGAAAGSAEADAAATNPLPAGALTLPAATGRPLELADAEALHEAADGRVWTARLGEAALLRLDFDAGSIDTLRSRSGPGAAQLPFLVTGGPDGTLRVADAAGAGVLRVDAAGRRVGREPLPDGAPVATARGDTLGRWTWSVPVAGADSARLLEAAGAAAVAPDTVGTVHVPAATVRLPAAGRAIEMAPEGTARDLWGVLPDGTRWIARGGPHRVDYRLPDGTRTVGGPRAYTPIPSTDADRGLLRGLPAPPDVAVDAIVYADTKGPFREARAFPDGAVWTWMTQPAPKADERYAVFRPGEAETQVVVLPLHHRVVGTGAAHVYVAARTGAGTWRVSRHPRPDRPR